LNVIEFDQIKNVPFAFSTVQWSTREDFSNIVGERITTEWNTFQGTMGANCYINELTQGRRYFFRASSGNIKGWGEDPKREKFEYFQYSKLTRLSLAISKMTIIG
jgi:hypothetical protein